MDFLDTTKGIRNTIDKYKGLPNSAETYPANWSKSCTLPFKNKDRCRPQINVELSKNYAITKERIKYENDKKLFLDNLLSEIESNIREFQSCIRVGFRNTIIGEKTIEEFKTDMQEEYQLILNCIMAKKIKYEQYVDSVKEERSNNQEKNRFEDKYKNTNADINRDLHRGKKVNVPEKK